MQVLSEVDPDQLRELQGRSEPMWLDLRDPTDDDLATVGEILGLHELAVEDSREFGQRPKLDRYEDRLLLVFFGLHISPDGTPCEVEVHIHIAPGSVLTVSRVPPVELERVRESLQNASSPCSQGQLVYRVLDAVTDSVTDGLTTMAGEMDRFEQTIFTRPRARDRDRMAVLRRVINDLHRTLVVQHQAFDHALGPIVDIAGDAEDLRPYLADVKDHLWQSLDESDADRTTLTGMLETYSSEIQERLTIVATIFLPLTALTGFFGMNFNWLVDHVGSAWAFFGLGVGGLAVSCLLLVLWLRHSGLLDRARDRAATGSRTQQ